MLYIMAIGGGGAVFIIFNFPPEVENGKMTFPSWLRSMDQALIVLAVAAGVTGSFIHAAQSLSSYLGNGDFKASWGAWYLLRPWIGGVLALAIYFAFRAGLVGGGNTPNPYGVVAIGLLAGWFSKTTADKLQEVFETLFKTDGDKKRKDKLRGALRPVLTRIEPNPVAAGDNELRVVGEHFLNGATLVIGSHSLPTQFVSATQLTVSLADFAHRPAAGATVPVEVKNPEGDQPVSLPQELTFA